MSIFVNTNQVRPNRLESTKDEIYHVDMARWALGGTQNPLHVSFIQKSIINWEFYKGNQWIFDEDLESFFLDESGDVRNRIKMARNLIRPMVEQYVGNAVRLDYDAGVKATSDIIKNRREKELNRMLFMTKAAKAIPEFKEAISEKIPIGDTEMQTEERFETLFVDSYEEVMEWLLQYIEEDVDIQDIKVRCTKDLAITGMGIYKGYEQNQRYLGERKDPMFFFFDRTALKPDLTDAEFMGEWYNADVPTLFERFQNLSNIERKAIEAYSVKESSDMNRVMHNYYYANGGGNKIPVYEVYWKDFEEEEYGYIKDDYGYPFFTRINHEDSKYSDKDLIKPPKDGHKKILKKGKKKAKIYVDVMRYCIFTPKEIIGMEKGLDIVYEYGEVEFDEKYKLDPSSVHFPYKVATWSYDKGEVLSPLDDAIDPQRFMNRLHSVAESHINNSRGSGTVISKDAIDARDGEEEVLSAINKSKPIFVDTTRTGSVQNSVGEYGTTIGQGTLSLFNVIREMSTAMSDITGINEAMTGNQGGSDALVGVIQAQIQRGSLVQEPFYYSLTNMLKQAYQHMATVGKRIYANNPRRLAIMTGDKGSQIISITKDMMLEDFRIFIKRKQSEAVEIQTGDGLIFTLLQAGLIDQYRASQLLGRSSSDKIARSMREYQNELKQAQRQQADAQAQQSIQDQQDAQIMAQAEDEAMQAQMEMEDNRMNKEIQGEMQKIDLRNKGQMEKEEFRARNK